MRSKPLWGFDFVFERLAYSAEYWYTDTRRAASLRVFFCVSTVVLVSPSAQLLYHAMVWICKRKTDSSLKPMGRPVASLPDCPY